MSIGNALKRKGITHNFTILSSSRFSFLADEYFKHIEIPVENEIEHSKENYKSSILYKTLMELKPDLLIVDHIWFTLCNFITELPFKKIYLSTQVDDTYFNLSLGDTKFIFKPDNYDFIFAIEPHYSSIKMKQLHPFIIRNKDEILSGKNALSKLDLQEKNKNCLFAINGMPNEFEEIKKMYSYLEGEGYDMFYTSNYKGGIFPIVDYFNAFDMIVCSAGYNAFWEAKYFNKEAILIPVPRRYENQQKRIDAGIDYKFDKNGADQLTDIIALL